MRIVDHQWSLRLDITEAIQPHRPLFHPVQLHHNSTDVFLLNLPAPSCRPRQEQELFLDVRGEVEECEDLGGAGAGDLSVAGEFGVVGDLTGAEEVVTMRELARR